jgi:hypothetical protein
MTDKKNLAEQIRYWRIKHDKLIIEYNKLDNYIRGLKDALYLTGSRK